MTISEIKTHSEEHGTEEFMAAFPFQTCKCKWLDLHVGLFTVDHEDYEGSFVSVGAIENMLPNLVCIPLEP